MRTIAISNYKDGVGKAATAMNLAAIYAGRGRRTEAIAKRPADSLGAGDLQRLKEVAELASEMLESATAASKAPSTGS